MNPTMQRRPPPNPAQRVEQRKALCRALIRIAEAWPDALEASESWGYPIASPGPKAAAGEAREDPSDPLHCRHQSLASRSGAAAGRPTENVALRGEPAVVWIDEAKCCLVMLLRSSGSEAYGERRWTGPFDPPRLLGTLKLAARDVVEMWPLGTAVLLERIHRLANEAAWRWPKPPNPGDTVETPEGPVTVGRRTVSVETCAECGGTIAGTALDPVRRIDGKAFHLRPCWETVRKRRQRRAS